MKLKVCGLKFKDNILEVSKIQPDFMGFIFYEKSSRFFNSEIPHLPSDIKKVGVFVNAELEHISKMVDNYQLDFVQLHGNESASYCKALQKRKIEVIKVFSIKDQFNFSQLKPFEDVCKYYLFDTKGKHPGGNGYTFNWDVLNAYPSQKPFFLSGGIGISELEQLQRFKHNKASEYCFAIDVNSKFEIEAGLKNSKELETFKYELQHKY